MTELYNAIYEDLTLRQAGVILGIILMVIHAIAYVQRPQVMNFLVALPRNRKAGIVLLIIATAWSFLMISEMDLGEFYTIRQMVKFFLPIGCFLVIQYVDEFLSVRALGAIMMLAAAPFLNAAFLEPPTTRLLIPFIAYIWIIVGMFWVGMPFLMRDWIKWLGEKENRYQIGCISGAAYGLLTLICAVSFWSGY
ncbi:MAG: hypothetical protein AAGH89_05065 [Verrucomicrobiota bacterium]